MNKTRPDNTRRHGCPQPGHATRRSSGMVLLEVVLALTLFFVVAVFVMDGLRSSLRGVRAARLEADAADLSTTVFSLIELGELPMNSTASTALEDYASEQWTYEVQVSAVSDQPELSTLQHVEIIVRNESESFTHRTSHVVWQNPIEPPEDDGLPDASGLDELTGQGGGT